MPNCVSSAHHETGRLCTPPFPSSSFWVRPGRQYAPPLFLKKGAGSYPTMFEVEFGKPERQSSNQAIGAVESSAACSPFVLCKQRLV